MRRNAIAISIEKMYEIVNTIKSDNSVSHLELEVGEEVLYYTQDDSVHLYAYRTKRQTSVIIHTNGLYGNLVSRVEFDFYELPSSF